MMERQELRQRYKNTNELTVEWSDPRSEGEGLSQLVSYTVTTKELSTTVTRRFGDVLWLWEMAAAEEPWRILPPPPEKSVTSAFSGTHALQLLCKSVGDAANALLKTTAPSRAKFEFLTNSTSFTEFKTREKQERPKSELAVALANKGNSLFSKFTNALRGAALYVRGCNKSEEIATEERYVLDTERYLDQLLNYMLRGMKGLMTWQSSQLDICKIVDPDAQGGNGLLSSGTSFRVELETQVLRTVEELQRHLECAKDALRRREEGGYLLELGAAAVEEKRKTLLTKSSDAATFLQVGEELADWERMVSRQRENIKCSDAKLIAEFTTFREHVVSVLSPTLRKWSEAHEAYFKNAAQMFQQRT
eukprot:GEMP01014243.1.p1 GENE.GEMP01014243.1~~GEMP01014243.1.p1  ORF type:complete len:363 (+),score=96.73 GEMP01014243.1:195-1283(+)